ncbi:MAG: YqaA family protein [Crocinitomicaceae bacterium]
MELETLGQLGLFISSFLAATFFPIGCEAIFLALLSSASGISDSSFQLTVANATFGNTLGAIFTYLIGVYLPIDKALSFLKIKKDRFNKVKEIVRAKAKTMALFAWLPILGDPIALALGHVRANLYLIIPMMAVGKFVRFFILGIIALYFKSLLN